MKKMIKAIMALIIFILLILGFRFGGSQILNNAALSLRPWVDTVVIVTVGISANVIFVLLIIILANKFKKKRETTMKKVVIKGICTIGILLCIVLGLCTSWATLMGFALGYHEEHIVDRDKRKMVAVVESFSDVNVYYYSYKNWIIMGNNRLIYEWYGNGGYDPLDGKHAGTPKKTIYYYERDTITGD